MKFFAAFALAVALAPAALPKHQTFVINPDASEVKITLKTTHEIVNGTFHVQSGSIKFDPSNPRMSGSVVVLAGSGKTGNHSRDKKMNKDILRVEQYATVTFEPKTYTGTIAPSGDSTLQVSGTFTLLGKPHEITVPMLVHLDGASANAKAHFVVPYVQWGLRIQAFCFGKRRMTSRSTSISLAPFQSDFGRDRQVIAATSPQKQPAFIAPAEFRRAQPAGPSGFGRNAAPTLLQPS